MAMTKRLWSLSALAVEFNCDRRTIANALKEVPADGEQSGFPAWFLLTAIRAMWPAADANGEVFDPVQERARKDRALAISTEIKNDLAQGRVVLIDEAIAIMTGSLAVVRNKILGLASRVAPRLVMQREAEPIRALLYDEIVLILEELSSGDDLRSLAGGALSAAGRSA